MLNKILILLAIAVAIAGAMNTKITTYEEEQRDANTNEANQY